jgi:pimeloyl-ACP methyl ester carboxylesterase
MEKIEIAQQKVYFSSFGEPAQGTILMLHGWGQEAVTWGNLPESLGNFGFRVFTPDLPGFGQSPKPPDDWGIPEYAEVVKKFIEKIDPKPLLGKGGAVLVGHSFGGRLGIYLAAQYPELVEKLILVNSAGFRRKRHYLGTVIGFTGRVLQKLRLKTAERVGRKIAQRALGTQDYYQTGGMKKIFQNVISLDLTNFMRQVKPPTLIIHGRQDVVVPVRDARRMHGLIENSQLEIIKDAMHFVHQEKPELFLGLVKKFIKGK